MNSEEMIRLASINVEAWGAGDWQRMREPYAPDVVCHEFGTQRSFRGIDQFVQSYQAWKDMAADGTGRVLNAFAIGNTVILEVLWTGTQTGPLVGPGGAIPPSGKAFSVPAAQIAVFKDDKIVEMRHYFDLMTLLQQIGAAPKPMPEESKAEISAGM
jgi:steroid delta-isomerase-like uncharacterized protein